MYISEQAATAKGTHKATDKLPVKRSGRQGKDAGGDGERGHEVADPTIDLAEGWRRGRNSQKHKSINQQYHRRSRGLLTPVVVQHVDEVEDAVEHGQQQIRYG